MAGLFLFFAGIGAARAQTVPDPVPPAQNTPQTAPVKKPKDYEEVSLPSALPTGDATVDTIRFRLYASQTVEGGAPAVVLLPPTNGDSGDRNMQRIAEYLARNGVECALMNLPFHGNRKKKGLTPAEAFVGYDVDRNSKAFAQGASDVSTVITYLQTARNVDKTRISVAGLSLGAIVAHLAMGQDDRINGGVAILGAGDLPDLYRRSFVARLNRVLHPSPARYDAYARFQKLSPSDPLTWADKNRPRRVLMIQAARDLLIPPHDALELWEALDRPPIRWVDTNHFALNLAVGPLERAALQYLRGVWTGKSDKELDKEIPQIPVPLIKTGFITQFGGGSQLGFTPAISYQFASLGTQRTHTSLLYADLGLTGRGPFVGVGITANSFLDVGFASRLTPRVAPPRPYVGFHVAF